MLDEDRLHAPIHVVTEGALAESFDRIFLVGRVRVEPAQVDERIVMEAGRVVERNPPSAT